MQILKLKGIFEKLTFKTKSILVLSLTFQGGGHEN